MYKGKRIAVVMPAYNADSKIVNVIKRIPNFYDKFIVVDDKSRDNTLNVLKALKPRIKNMILLIHKKNKGYGGAQKALYKQALTMNIDYVVLLHDDGQYDPQEMSALLDGAIENDADIVLGSRILGGKMIEGGVPFYKIIGNKVLTALENLAFGTKITEFHTGYRVYSKRALKLMEFDRLTDKYYFDSEVILQLIGKKVKLVEVPISVNYRENVTAANPITYGFEILYLIVRHIVRKIK